MTKSSKLIATLGVVAGLGVAALPLGSVFATVDTTGNVEVDVEVLPAISMTITGNNDLEDLYDKGTSGNTEFASVDHFDNNADGVGIDEPTSGTVDTHETTAAKQSSLLASSSFAELLPNSAIHGTFGETSDKAGTNFGSIITVYTNNSTGYNLTMRDENESTALTNANGDTIPTNATISAGASAWAYKTVYADNTNVASPAYATIKASNVQGDTIATRNTETKYTEEETVKHGSVSKVAYGVSTSSDQATGVYSDVIVYTATTNV